MEDWLACNSLAESLRTAARTSKGIIFVPTRRDQFRYTYRRLYEDALGLLFRLQHAGVNRGDEAIILVADQLDFLRAFWACVLCGILPAAITAGASREHHRKFSMIWKQLAHPHLIASEKIAKELNDYADETGLGPRPRPEQVTLIKDSVASPSDDSSLSRFGRECPTDLDAPAFIQFSSGSTAHPKGVVLSHRNVIANIRAMRYRSRTENSEQVLLSWLPLTHDMGLIGFHLTPVVSQWDHVLMPPELFQRDPVFWLEQISAHRATVTGSPNSGLRHTLRHFQPKPARELDLSCLRFLLNGGEPISGSLCREFSSTLRGYGLSPKAIFPVYGLAEASLCVTFPEPEEPFRTVSVCGSQLGLGQAVVHAAGNGSQPVSLVEVGAPVKGCFVRVVDMNGEPLPENVVGRIQIRGENVSRGYYAAEGLPSGDTGRWLETGDLGFLRSGRLIVTGREKEILFANGQNLYPEDIERVIAEAIGIEVDRVAVARYEQESLTEGVAAFVTHRGPLENFLPLAETIKEHVAREFSLSLRQVVPVRRIPRTTSGKVQRVRLGLELRNGEFDEILRSVCGAPESRDETENNELDGGARIIEIWREVLADPAISATDNFFARGGNSLSAARMVSRVGDELGLELPLRLIFDHPVAREFAAQVTRRSDTSPGNRLRPVVLPRPDHYPLLPEQKSLCALQKAYPQAIAYNIPVAIRLTGVLDIAQVRRALHLLIRRHSALRTRFVMAEGRLVQRVEKQVDVTVELEPATAAELNRKLVAFVRPFALEAAPLFRAKLFRLSETEHVLACDGHHAVLDGLSVVKLLAELIDIYNDTPPTSSAPQFCDYVLRTEAAATRANNQLAATVRPPEEPPVVDLPTDFSRPALPTFTGGCVRFALNESQTAALRKLAAVHGTTLYVVLLSLYCILLARLSGQKDLTVASPFAGRTDQLSWPGVGMFVRTMLLQIHVPEQFSGLLRHVSQETIQAFDEVKISPEHQSRELFQHMFVLQDFALPKLFSSELKLELVEFPRTSAKCDLCLEGWDEGERISFTLEYRTSLFRQETIERFAAYYQNIVAAVISDPHSAIPDLPILDRREERHLIFGFNDTTADYPAHETIHALFEQQARRTPAADALIVADTDQRFSYAELNDSATALAHVLRAHGVQQQRVVGILLDRSPALVVAVLAVLKAGGAYLPLATDLPAKRIELLVKESDAIAVVATTDAHERLARLNVPLIDPSMVTHSEPQALASEVNSRDLAYVIYTSGTSGVPKGVMIEHRSLVNYVMWANRTYLAGDKLNFALHTPLSVDLTVTSLFVPLISGNAVVIYPPADAATTLRAIFNDPRTGAVKLTPTHLKLAINLGESMRPGCLIVGGENFETDLACELARKHPHLKIYNEYGPTEATVGCLIHRFDNRHDYGPSVPIGSPVDNCRIYLLDEDGHPAVRGARGEIYISGVCLARGYAGNQALAAERFVPNPFCSSQLMYRTGDLARRLPDDSLVFLGRRDEQTKIRGYRVSLGEIRAVLLSFSGVRDAVVVTEPVANGEREIVAYLVTDAPVTRASLRAFLAQELQPHLIPSRFLSLRELPVTAAGKLDHEALAALASPIESGVKFDAPVGETEVGLGEIWGRVLGVKRVGRTDNFFDLGGDSIKALLIASQAEQAGFGISVPQVLQSQTLAELSKKATRLEGSIEAANCEPGPKTLSPIEAWYFEQQFAHPERYCQAVVVSFKKRADVESLREALRAVVNHHDAFRLNADASSRSVWFNERSQVDEPSVMVLDHFQEGDPELRESIRRACEHLSNSFDLRDSLLLQAALVRTRNTDLLLLVAHHLVIDGFSWRIVLQDLETAYEAISKQETPQLPSKTASLQTWIEHLSRYAQSPQALRQQEFWREMSAPIFSSSDDTAADVITQYEELGCDETQRLLLHARRIYKTNPASLLLTGVLRWLPEEFGDEPNLIELEHHGRNLASVDLSRTVGWLTALYPLALTLPAGTVNEQVKAIEQQLKRVPDDGLGYGVLKYLAGCEELQHPGRAIVRFNYLGEFGAELDGRVFEYASEFWSCTQLAPETRQHSPLQIDCLTLAGRLRVTLNGWRLRSGAGHRLMNHLRYVIDQSAAETSLRLTPLDFDALSLEQRDLDEILT